MKDIFYGLFLPYMENHYEYKLLLAQILTVVIQQQKDYGNEQPVKTLYFVDN